MGQICDTFRLLVHQSSDLSVLPYINLSLCSSNSISIYQSVHPSIHPSNCLSYKTIPSDLSQKDCNTTLYPLKSIWLGPTGHCPGYCENYIILQMNLKWSRTIQVKKWYFYFNKCAIDLQMLQIRTYLKMLVTKWVLRQVGFWSKYSIYTN